MSPLHGQLHFLSRGLNRLTVQTGKVAVIAKDTVTPLHHVLTVGIQIQMRQEELTFLFTGDDAQLVPRQLSGRMDLRLEAVFVQMAGQSNSFLSRESCNCWATALNFTSSPFMSSSSKHRAKRLSCSIP